MILGSFRRFLCLIQVPMVKFLAHFKIGRKRVDPTQVQSFWQNLGFNISRLQQSLKWIWGLSAICIISGLFCCIYWMVFWYITTMTCKKFLFNHFAYLPRRPSCLKIAFFRFSEVKQFVKWKLNWIKERHFFCLKILFSICKKRRRRERRGYATIETQTKKYLFDKL